MTTQKSTDEDPNWEQSTDIIVVGSGFAGLMAAIRAAELGDSVIVLEKRLSCGGNSLISDGAITATGCRLQKEEQIKDTADLLLQDMLKAGDNANQLELAKIVTDYAADSCDWLINDLCVAFQPRIYQFAGHSAARSLVTSSERGGGFIKKMLNRLRELGVSPKTGHHMTELLINDDGRVSGVRVKQKIGQAKQKNQIKAKDATPKLIFARKAVILATGGFASDIEFRHTLNQDLANIDSTNIREATAETIQEAIRIGADTVDLANIQLAPFTSPDEKGYGVSALLASYAVFPYGILINPHTGRRFVNELADRKTQADAMLGIGSPCIGITDQNGVNLSGKSIDKCLRRNVVHKFETLTELADHYKLPVQELLDSTERYNQSVLRKYDNDFKKTILNAVRPLKSPYYSVRLWPKAHYTVGGLKINSMAQVLDTHGNVIPGLYAAGEVTGGVHGASRLSTNSITECLVFGRIAGEQAVQAPFLQQDLVD